MQIHAHLKALNPPSLLLHRPSGQAEVLVPPLAAQEMPTPKFPLQGRAHPCLSLCSETAPSPLWPPDVQQRLEKSLGTAEPKVLQTWARQTLGLTGVTLPDAATRKANFETFAARHFPQRPADSDEFDAENYGPTPEMPVYQLLADYAKSDYGALMIQKVLNEAREKPFQVKVVAGVSPKAWDDLMILPPDFPKPGARFAFGGQVVDPLAILHHEFEHTRFGKHPQSLENILAEEALTVAQIENPVRILNGYEPRYTYTQLDAMGQPLVTLNIFNPELQLPGPWTFDPQDPRRLISLP